MTSSIPACEGSSSSWNSCDICFYKNEILGRLTTLDQFGYLELLIFIISTISDTDMLLATLSYALGLGVAKQLYALAGVDRSRTKAVRKVSVWRAQSRKVCSNVGKLDSCLTTRISPEQAIKIKLEYTSFSCHHHSAIIQYALGCSVSICPVLFIHDYLAVLIFCSMAESNCRVRGLDVWRILCVFRQ